MKSTTVLIVSLSHLELHENPGLVEIFNGMELGQRIDPDSVVRPLTASI